MKLIKIFFNLVLLFFMMKSHAQQFKVFDIKSIEIDSVQLIFKSPNSFIEQLNIDNFHFEEYIEEIPLASGDKLHYYTTDDIKLIIVFFKEKDYLQNVILYTSKHSLLIEDHRISVGDIYKDFKKLFPAESKKYNPNGNIYFTGSIFLKFEIQNDFDYLGNIKIDFKDGVINRIIIGLIQ